MGNKMNIKKILSLTVLALSTSFVNAATFNMEKYSTGYSIDGNGGAIEGQQIYLWTTSTSNVNQNWGQISQGDGYYSYKKEGTNLCWDGGSDGANGQAVTLENCDSSNYDQHWEKVKITSGTEIYRFEKRNATGYSIDGNNGATNSQSLYLWGSNSSNENQQWELTRTDRVILDPDVAPSENFDLSQWYLSVPTDTDDSGTADSIKEDKLNDSYDDEYFYTGSDGGMVFVCYIDGYKTSTNTSYTRTELREMLRAGDTSIDTSGVNENNWVFSTAPSDQQDAAGGVDGNMKATLAVNHVTSTGDSSQQGRVIIGQIHAASDEPIRLYYRLLDGHTNGSIYFAHEPSNGNDEQWYEMIGSKSSSASEPSDGIELGEVFSYEIDVVGDTMTVSIIRDGKDTITEIIDMSDSGYDGYYEDSDGEIKEDYMYFKVGAYNQNNTGDDDDYVQVTFYSLEHTHD
jgi:poly(beta-D-mannuronate) lyase